MSTLAEIESVIANLPPQDQLSLFEWLQSRVPSKLAGTIKSSDDRKQWLAELAELRTLTQTGKLGTPLQQIMEDLREERF
jgi:hypothetical protein